MTGRRRRANGEGSIFRRSSGQWVGTLDLGWIDGKRVRRSVYGRTRAEVAAKLEDLQQAERTGVDLTLPPRTVGEWLTEWLHDVKATDGTRPSTLDRYRQVVNTHLVPGLGRVRLEKLGARDVQRFLTERRKTRSAGTVAKIHGVLRSALSDAVRFDLVARNVAKSVKVPSGTADERRAPTVAEVRKFLEAAADDRLVEVFTLAATMGLRRGELLGLQWPDVDLERRVLHIRRTVQRSGGELRIVEPKTKRSRRRLPLPRVAVEAFERQHVRQLAEQDTAGSAWQRGDWVFPSTIGTSLEPRNLRARSTWRARPPAWIGCTCTISGTPVGRT